MTMTDIELEVGSLIIEHEREHGLTSGSYLNNRIYHFYYLRIKHLPYYGLVQGRKIIKMICRSAFNDSSLTDNEAIVIMESCLDSRLDNILLEVNYNEGW